MLRHCRVRTQTAGQATLFCPASTVTSLDPGHRIGAVTLRGLRDPSHSAGMSAQAEGSSPGARKKFRYLGFMMSPPAPKCLPPGSFCLRPPGIREQPDSSKSQTATTAGLQEHRAPRVLQACWAAGAEVPAGPFPSKNHQPDTRVSSQAGTKQPECFSCSLDFSLNHQFLNHLTHIITSANVVHFKATLKAAFLSGWDRTMK